MPCCMRCITFGLLAAIAGCTDGAAVEDVVTIPQGIYGVLSTSSDVAGEPSQNTPHKPLAVYAVLATTELDGMTASNQNGVYQYELIAGHYELCVNDADPNAIYDQWLHNCAGPCTLVDISQG